MIYATYTRIIQKATKAPAHTPVSTVNKPANNVGEIGVKDKAEFGLDVAVELGLLDTAELDTAEFGLLFMAAVATVYSEPANEVTTPAPDSASVIALPPSEVIMVTALPPTEVTSWTTPAARDSAAAVTCVAIEAASEVRLSIIPRASGPAAALTEATTISAMMALVKNMVEEDTDGSKTSRTE